MLRRDGDFLFCWTAMCRAPVRKVQCLSRIRPRRPANGERFRRSSCRRARRCSSRAAARTAARGSARPRSARAPASPCPPRPGPARARRPARRGSRPSVAASTSSSSVCTSNASASRQRWQRSCSVPLTFSRSAGRPRSSRMPCDRVGHFACVRREHVAQARQIAQRPDPLLRCAGRREFEAVDHRLMRHKGADDIIA